MTKNIENTGEEENSVSKYHIGCTNNVVSIIEIPGTKTAKAGGTTPRILKKLSSLKSVLILKLIHCIGIIIVIIITLVY